MKKSELNKIIKEKVVQKIKESPDVVYYKGDSHIYRDDDAITFGYFDNVLYTSEDIDPNIKGVSKPYTHGDLGTWIKHQIFHDEIPEPKNYDPDEEYYLGREDFKFAGRLWTRPKMISFWDYPKTAAELDKVIKDLNKKVPGLNLNDDWKIDLGVDEKDRNLRSKVEPISSYKSSKEATPADAGKAHIAFGKQGNVPSGVGSKFKFKTQIPGETVAQMRARTSINENKTKMKKSELQQIIREEISKVMKESSDLRLAPYEKLLNKMTIYDYDKENWQLNIIEIDNEMDPSNVHAGEEMYIAITGRYSRDSSTDSIWIPKEQWEDFKRFLNTIK